MALSFVSMINGFQHDLKAERDLAHSRGAFVYVGAVQAAESGFRPMTPREGTSPIVTFAKKDTTEVAGRLKRANVDIAVYDHRIRITPSVYNDQADIDKLLNALS